MSELNWQRLLASRAAYGVACFYYNGIARLVHDGHNRPLYILTKENAQHLAAEMTFDMPGTFYYKAVPLPFAGDWYEINNNK